MTREEILAMPAGRELDVLVAEKVMGFEPGTVLLGGWYPSVDISAAWEVVGKFKCYELSGVIFHTCKLWKTISQVSFEYQGKTAPEAIVKAALLAVMEEQSHEL